MGLLQESKKNWPGEKKGIVGRKQEKKKQKKKCFFLEEEKRIHQAALFSAKLVNAAEWKHPSPFHHVLIARCYS